jgi:hypothetical protein
MTRCFSVLTTRPSRAARRFVKVAIADYYDHESRVYDVSLSGGRSALRTSRFSGPALALLAPAAERERSAASRAEKGGKNLSTLANGEASCREHGSDEIASSE